MPDQSLQKLLVFLNDNSVSGKDVALEVIQSLDPFSRKTLPGHITASAFILDQAMRKLLLIHHAGLDCWLQPGGHVDPGETPLQAAVREAHEEVGLSISCLTSEILDVDVHRIPANPSKDEPEHWHIDVRYLFVSKNQDVVINESECRAFRWVDLDLMQKVDQEKYSRVTERARQFLATLRPPKAADKILLVEGQNHEDACE